MSCCNCTWCGCSLPGRPTRDGHGHLYCDHTCWARDIAVRGCPGCGRILDGLTHDVGKLAMGQDGRQYCSRECATD